MIAWTSFLVVIHIFKDKDRDLKNVGFFSLRIALESYQLSAEKNITWVMSNWNQLPDSFGTGWGLFHLPLRHERRKKRPQHGRIARIVALLVVLYDLVVGVVTGFTQYFYNPL
jgi:hypothetical protein